MKNACLCKTAVFWSALFTFVSNLHLTTEATSFRRQLRGVEVWSDACEILDRSTKFAPECGHVELPITAPNSTYNVTSMPVRQCLVTGVGRSGTTYTSTALTNFGFNMNHDNKLDNCPCPGVHGSVSHVYALHETEACEYPSWSPEIYHRFRRVVHQVRAPLHVVLSRAAQAKFDSTELMRECALHYHVVTKNETMRLAHLALQKWVLQNTFITQIADYTINVESATTISYIRVCNECGLGDIVREVNGMAQKGCPTHGDASLAVAPISHSINRNHTNKTLHFHWDALYQTDQDMTLAAVIVARALGYNIHPPVSIHGLVVRCGFITADGMRKWHCLLDRSQADPIAGLHYRRFLWRDIS
eukprot:m.31951 g.31951  ORF g.31951 m.31951 type:complete len:360 (-) comp14070_c0_seq2:95-1174(-)